MSAIFKSAPGVLVAVRSQGANAPSAGLLTIEGLQTGAQGVIITQFDSSERAAVQKQQSIGGPAYLYSFGQELSSMSCTLVAYPASCDGSSNGVTAGWSFYLQKRVAPNRVTPIRLTFGGITLYAFVIGMRTTVSAQQGMPVIGLTLEMVGWVDEASFNSAAVSPAGTSDAAPASSVSGLPGSGNGEVTQSENGNYTGTVADVQAALAQAPSDVAAAKSAWVSSWRSGASAEQRASTAQAYRQSQQRAAALRAGLQSAAAQQGYTDPRSLNPGDRISFSARGTGGEVVYQ